MATSRGLAFAALEDGDQLVDWGACRTAVSQDTAEIIDKILHRTRPLFVAVEDLRKSRKGLRGWALNHVIAAACERHDIMMFRVKAQELAAGVNIKRPLRHDIAERIARWCPEIADKLPKRRAAWEGEDDRLGLFIAVATAAAAWGRFNRRRRRHKGRGQNDGSDA